MEEVLELQSRSAMWFFFVVGILATLAYRIIIVLNFYDPLWVKISWYVGTVGFIFYFGYLYIVQSKRADLAIDNHLLSAVDKAKGIKREQRRALEYIVRSNARSKAKWNSGVIFLLSVLALIVGLVLDLGKF
jgi:hypothetical protein